MRNSDLQFFDVGVESARRRIAYRRDATETSDHCGLMWFPGFKSDMTSTKATALSNYAQSKGADLIRFDYSGHGLSEGDFDKGTIGAWLEEAEAVFTHLTRGPQIFIGSSMGGYIALLLLRHLQNCNSLEARRVSSLILIAPAWDMTEELMWKKFSYPVQQKLLEQGYVLQPSEYGAPYVITRLLIEEGRRHLLSQKPFNPQRPIFIIQGLKDTAVPPEHVVKLKNLLQGNWITTVEVEDGEHRLSRPQDLEILFEIINKAYRLCLL